MKHQLSVERIILFLTHKRPQIAKLSEQKEKILQCYGSIYEEVIVNATESGTRSMTKLTAAKYQVSGQEGSIYEEFIIEPVDVCII